jgi:hypothetical protein
MRTGLCLVSSPWYTVRSELRTLGVRPAQAQFTEVGELGDVADLRHQGSWP